MLSLFAEPEHIDRSEDSIVIPGRGVQNVIIICPFGSSEIPSQVGPLPETDSDWLAGTHILADPGAEFFTQELSANFQCHSISAQFSRIVVDINLPSDHQSTIPVKYGDNIIQMNANLDARDRQIRIQTYHTPFHQRCAKLIKEFCPVENSIIIGVQSCPRIWNNRVVEFDINIMFTDEHKRTAEVLQRIFFEHGLQSSFNNPYSGRMQDGNALFLLGQVAQKRDNVTLMFRADLLEIPYFRLTVLRALGDGLVDLKKVVRTGKTTFKDYSPPQPGGSREGSKFSYSSRI